MILEIPYICVYMRVSLSISVLLVTSVLMVFTSCSRIGKCGGDADINEGLIVSDTTLCTNCASFANEEQGFVINSESDLQNVRNYLYGNAVYCEFRPFNLAKYTLFGMHTHTSCESTIRRVVEENNEDSTYTYTIFIRECGDCLEKNYQPNWVLVPKIKMGYTVNFEISRI